MGFNGFVIGLVVGYVLFVVLKWRETTAPPAVDGEFPAPSITRTPAQRTARKALCCLTKLDSCVSLRAGTASGSAAMLSRFLYRRAWRVAVRAKDAAIPRLGFEHRAATLALIEELAGVRWHCFRRLMTAARACDRGLKLHRRGRAPYLTLAG